MNNWWLKSAVRLDRPMITFNIELASDKGKTFEDIHKTAQRLAVALAQNEDGDCFGYSFDAWTLPSKELGFAVCCNLGRNRPLDYWLALVSEAAEAAGQDCIAVKYEADGLIVGALVGPGRLGWGEWDHELFHHFPEKQRGNGTFDWAGTLARCEAQAGRAQRYLKERPVQAVSAEVQPG